MAAALPTVTVSLIYLLWDACRRTRQRPAAPAPVAELPGGDEHLERRLDCLTLVVRPVPRRY